MSEATEASKKVKAEVTMIKMDDGREVGFAGKRKMDKSYNIDESKIQVDGDSVLLGAGAVEVQIDFLNGKTVRFSPPPSIIAKAIGHGLSQKLGDEAASEKDIDDAYMAIEELAQRLGSGDWTVAREAGGSFAGASVVVRAIMEVTGQSQEKVKEFLQKKLDTSKVQAEANGTKAMSRAQLYDSFRGMNTKTGPIIDRMEKEKQAKAAVISAEDANAELEAMKAG